MTDQSLPISEQYRIVSKKWVAEDSAARLREETKSAFYSQLMAQHMRNCIKANGKAPPVSQAEIEVKSSSEWKGYVENMVYARESANLLKVQLEYIRMKHAEEQSANATRRAEMRL